MFVSFFFDGNSKSIFIMNLNIYLFLVALGYWSDMQYHLSPFHNFLYFFLNFLWMQFLSVLKFHIVAESSLLQIFIRISFCSFDTGQLLDSIFGSSLITVLQSQQFPLQCSWACLWFFPMISPVGVCLQQGLRNTVQLHFGNVHVIWF